MIAPCLMSCKHVVIRMYKGSYDPISQAVDGFLIEYSLLSVITYILVQDNTFDFTFNVFLTGTTAGCFMCVSRILLAIAIAVGIAGPAQSLNSTHGIHQSMWSLIVDGQSITLLQVFGLVLALAGVGIISSVNYVLTLFKKKSHKEKCVSESLLEKTGPKE